MTDERPERDGADSGRGANSRGSGNRRPTQGAGRGRPGGGQNRGRNDRGGRGDGYRGRSDRDDRGGGRDGNRSGGYRGRSDRNDRDGNRSGGGGGYRGRSDRDDRGGGRDGNRSGGGGGYRGRNDRNDRDGGGGYRGRNDRNDRGGRDGNRSGGGGGYRGRNDRNDRDGGGGYRGRSDRNDRGGRDGNRSGGGGGYRGRNDRNDRDGGRRDWDREDRDRGAGPAKWGGLARRGAARLNDEASEQDLRDAGEHVHDAPYDEDDEARARREARQAKREAGEANRERLRSEAQAAIDRAGPAARKGSKGPKGAPPALERSILASRKLPDPKFALSERLGKGAGSRAWTELGTAADHLEAGRAGAAQPIAQSLYRKAPEVLEVAEIWGLTLYNLGRWREAIEVLEDVRDLSGLADNNPVLADAHRAVGNHADVAFLWDELREASPASEIMTEGRIVAAGSLADQGDIRAGVRLLEKGWKRPKRPFEHHLRRAYALADLYERAGEQSRAKELFAWIAHHDSGYVDAAHRSR